MSYSSKFQPHSAVYFIGNHCLERVSEIRNLGIILETKLTFIMRICSNIFDSHTLTLNTLYIALVKSILEYACIVWQPFRRIGRIQWSFTRFAFRHLHWNDADNPIPP